LNNDFQKFEFNSLKNSILYHISSYLSNVVPQKKNDFISQTERW